MQSPFRQKQLRKQKNNKSLREKIEDKKNILVLPGVFDALTAKIAENVGFDAMFQTGYGSAASLALGCQTTAS